MTKEILLPHGKVALVDDEDFERINKYKWHVTNGYAVRKLTATSPTIRMHRVVVDCPENMEVDHINRNRLDNRRENLRICTHSQNGMNKDVVASNKSGFKGVSWHTRSKKWVAQIQLNKTRKHLGYYETPEAAAFAYDEAAIKNYGEFAVLNFGGL